VVRAVVAEFFTLRIPFAAHEKLFGELRRPTDGDESVVQAGAF
jgi:hypothetical protein